MGEMLAAKGSGVPARLGVGSNSGGVDTERLHSLSARGVGGRGG